MKFLMAQALAPNTKKTQDSYLKAWRRYADFAKVAMPVGGWHLAMFATSLVVEGRVRSADSLSNYVSAVRKYHHDLGMDCPTPSQFGPLDRIIKGLRNVSLRPVKKSRPITPTILLMPISRPHPFHLQNPFSVLFLNNAQCIKFPAHVI